MKTGDIVVITYSPSSEITEGNEYTVIGLDNENRPSIKNNNDKLMTLVKSTYYIKNQYIERKPYMDYFKEYLTKHRDTLFTVAVIVLVDHFVFNGTFRDKLKDMVDKLISKTEKKLLKD